MKDPNLGSLESTTLHKGSSSLLVTLADAQMMRQAILNYLESSEIGDRVVLAAATLSIPARIRSEGSIDVGGWNLQVDNGHVEAVFRLSENEQRAVGYIASLTKNQGKWYVENIDPLKILYRR